MLYTVGMDMTVTPNWSGVRNHLEIMGCVPDYALNMEYQKYLGIEPEVENKRSNSVLPECETAHVVRMTEYTNTLELASMGIITDASPMPYVSITARWAKNDPKWGKADLHEL